MNVHQQVLRGKIQSFPIVCLTITTSHSYYFQLLHISITSELTKYKLSCGVSPPTHIWAFSNFPLSFAWSGSYSYQKRSEAELCPYSSRLGISLYTSPATLRSSLHCLSSYSSNSTLLVSKWLSFGSIFFFILYLTWKHKLISHLYAGDATPLL